MALKTSVNGATPVLQNEQNRRDVIASYWSNGTNVKVYDDVTTTVNGYYGYDEDTAKSLAASLRVNTMADYRIRSSSTSPYSWIVCPEAKGTITTAESRRVGTAGCFR